LDIDPVKCKPLGTVFAVNAFGDKRIQKKTEGILCLSAHKEYVWLLVQQTRLDSVVAGFVWSRPEASTAKLLALELETKD